MTKMTLTIMTTLTLAFSELFFTTYGYVFMGKINKKTLKRKY